MFRWQSRAEKKVEKGILHVGIATEDMKLPRSTDIYRLWLNYSKSNTSSAAPIRGGHCDDHVVLGL